MTLPLNNCKVTSEYGIIRKDGKLHKGIDLISASGDRKVKAIADGRVSYCGFDPTGFGNYVSILHGDNKKSLYCHLKSYSVSNNQEIKEGQVIGIEGTTGNSTGVHLHLEIRKNPWGKSDHINVADYLGIKNQKGVVEMEKEIAMTEAEAKRLIQKKTGFDDNTMFWLSRYLYHEDMFIKWAKSYLKE